MITKTMFLTGASALFVMTAACSAPTTSDELETPDVVDQGLAQRAQVVSTNADGTWVANATGTTRSLSANSALATFTGPRTAERRMGVCLLQRFGGTSPLSPSPEPCTTTADCTKAPEVLPQGGFRYCTASDSEGTIQGVQKYCYFRPGPPSAYCAGTPANGGRPIGIGSLASPPRAVAADGLYLSYACFEGCAATDPSASSPEEIVIR